MSQKTPSPSALETYAHEAISGKFNQTNELKPEPEEGFQWKSLVVPTLLFVIAGLILWVALKPDPKEYVEEAILEVLNSGQMPAVDSEATVSLSGDQFVALEKVRAWERVQTKIVEEFFHSNYRGKRVLCLSFGDDKKCEALTGRVGSEKEKKKMIENFLK